MCDFCNDILENPHFSFIDGKEYDEECNKENNTVYLESGLVFKMIDSYGTIMIVFSNSADEYPFGQVPIKYCPFCGRKII